MKFRCHDRRRNGTYPSLTTPLSRAHQAPTRHYTGQGETDGGDTYRTNQVGMVPQKGQHLPATSILAKGVGRQHIKRSGKETRPVVALDRPVVPPRLAVLLFVGSPTTDYRDVSVGSLTLHHCSHLYLPARLSCIQHVNTVNTQHSEQSITMHGDLTLSPFRQLS